MRRLMVAQWNMLAGELALPRFFPHVVPDQLLDWDTNRRDWITRYMTNRFAEVDLVCMQEVDHVRDWLEPLSASLSMTLLHHARPTTNMGRAAIVRNDGCAVMYRSSRFSLVASHCHHYVHDMQGLSRVRAVLPERSRAVQDAFHASLSRYNKTAEVSGMTDRLASLVALRPSSPLPIAGVVGSLSPIFVVANTHLYWDRTESGVQLSQIMELEDALERFIVDLSLPRGTPLFLSLCGDFNNVPESATYEYMRNDFMQHSKAVPYILPMRSAFVEATGSEPAFTAITTKKCETIDYIWYSASIVATNDDDAGAAEQGSSSGTASTTMSTSGSSASQRQGWCRAIAAQALPSREELRVELERDSDTTIDDPNLGLPGGSHPSDHLPIVVTFEL